MTSPSDDNILDRLDLAAEAEGLGVRFAGNANGDGWRPCHAVDREDRTPSAAFNVTTGWYHDHGGDGLKLSFFDLAARQGKFTDWQTAKDHYRRLVSPVDTLDSDSDSRSNAGFRANRNPRGKESGRSKPASKTFPTADAAADAYARQFKRPADHRWEYHDAEGELIGLVLRWNRPDGGKEIRPAALIGDSWQQTFLPEPRPLYGLPELLASTGTVWVCEGEKTADAVRDIGLTATTSPGGCKAAGKADWTPLAGKDVVVLPDNDQPGREYANGVVAILTALAPPAVVRILDLPGLPEKGDAYDWLNGEDADGNWRHGLGDAAEPDDLAKRLEALATAVSEWEPEPDDPADAPLVWKPFPTDTLPEPLAGYVRSHAAAIGCDESFVALPLLASVAGAIGNSRRILLKGGWSEPAIVWTATIGASGSTKSPGMEAGSKPLANAQREAKRQYGATFAKWQAGHLEWEKFAAEAKSAGEDPPEEPQQPVCPTLWIDDATIEAVGALLAENDRGVTVLADELDSWLGGFDQYRKGSGSDRAKWLKFHGGREARIDRRTGTPRTLYIPHAAVSVTGTIQPGVLRKHLTAENRSSGLAARLLFAWPPARQRRWTEAEPDGATVEAVGELFAKLYGLDLWTDSNGERKPGLVRLSTEAKNLYRAFYNEHGEAQAEQDDDLAAAFSKLEGYAARIALLFAMVRRATGETTGATEEVDAKSMADAIRLVRWFVGETTRVYGLIDESTADREQRELVTLIERRGGRIGEAELPKSGPRAYRKNPEAATTALQSLVTAGLARWETVRSATRTRRDCVLIGENPDPVDSDYARNAGFRANRNPNPAHPDVEADAPDDDRGAA